MVNKSRWRRDDNFRGLREKRSNAVNEKDGGEIILLNLFWTYGNVDCFDQFVAVRRHLIENLSDLLCKLFGGNKDQRKGTFSAFVLRRSAMQKPPVVYRFPQNVVYDG